MSPLVRPAVLPVCAVTSGGGGGNSDKWAPRQQRSWWGRSKQSLPHQPGGGRGGGGGGALDQVLGVLRRDGEFLQAAAGGSLRDVLWLRFLEKKQQQRKRPKPKPAEQQEEEEAAEAPPAHPQAPAFPAYPTGSSPPARAHAKLNPHHIALFLTAFPPNFRQGCLAWSW